MGRNVTVVHLKKSFIAAAVKKCRVRFLGVNVIFTRVRQIKAFIIAVSVKNFHVKAYFNLLKMDTTPTD